MNVILDMNVDDILAESSDDDVTSEEEKGGDGSQASGTIKQATTDADQLQKDLDKEKQRRESFQARRRGSGDDSVRRVSSGQGLDVQQFNVNTMVKRGTVYQQKASTFTDDKVIEGDAQAPIFADEAKIDSNPAKLEIEEGDGSGIQEPNLNDIMAESESDSDKNDQQVVQAKDFDENDSIDEDERAKILAELEDSNEDDQESSHSDESGDSSSSSQEDRGVISDDSFERLANKSIDSGPQDLAEVIQEENYLPFISQKYAFQNDVLEIIEQNERSYKITAEKMIQKNSKLDSMVDQRDELESDDLGLSQQRRLMVFKEFNNIATRFQAVQSAVSVPYCIACLENFVAIGSSDGAVRLFNMKDEQELKAITVKEVKQNPVISIDIKRLKGPNLIHIVAGHSKGQVVLYEIRGLPKYNTNSGLVGNISVRHIRTISGIHEGQVVQAKFYGVFRKDTRIIQIASSDIQGTVYLLKLTDDVLGYSCNKKCFYKKRMGGPSYIICPLYYDYESKGDNAGAFTTLDGNPYLQDRDRDLFDFDMGEELAQLRNHLLAFGSLDRIVLTQVQPELHELFYLERPQYIDAGVVPYLDWGEGLSPVYRDRTYPILAITWGRTVQLAIWTNHKEVGAKPEIKFDGFYICDGFSIDQCFFLDESLLFVLINKKEVKILYTQRFTPGVFDEKILQSQEPKKQLDHKLASQTKLDNKKYFLQIKEKFTGLVSTYAEVDKGYRLVQKEEIRHKDIIEVSSTQQRSKFNFHPTICKMQGSVIALGKTTVCQGKLIHWSEYLELIRRTNPDDWLKVLRAAIDIYNGKMVGLAGLPDEKFAREGLLRERMKELLRQNIEACIQDFQEGNMLQTSTLRVATEFCFRVGAIDHLFGGLFDMFAEAGLEQRYFENLEAFILSGKLRSIKIPQQILNRILQYYRQKDTELLEKSILNLNMYGQSQNLELAHTCETEFLTSALIYMQLTIYEGDQFMENVVCQQILVALYKVMTRAKIEKTKQEVLQVGNWDKDSTILFEQNAQEDKQLKGEAYDIRQEEKKVQMEERQKKRDIEHSRTYIGYKIYWVIQLFLEGKNFPSGQLSSFKWRMYVLDIARFITTPQFLDWFLDFDPQRFFKLIEPIYLQPEPYQYIYSQEDFLAMYKEDVPGLEKCPTHVEILTTMQKSIKKYIESEKEKNNGLITSKCEIAENSFMFFVARISKSGPYASVFLPQELIEQTIISQLQFHRKLIGMNLKVQDLLQAKSTLKTKSNLQIAQMISTKSNTTKVEIEDIKPDQQLYKYLVKSNESDVLHLVKLIEKSVDDEKIKEFCKEADLSPMFMVRIYLHQRLFNYQKCLQMFFKIEVIKEHVFQWLSEIQASNILCEKGLSDQMQSLILKNIGSFIEMSPEQSAKLTDQWFDSDYFKIVEAIKKYNSSKSKSRDLTFRFINSVLTTHEHAIVQEYQEAMMSGRSRDQSSYYNLILELTRILCKKQYRKFAMEYMQKAYIPIEDCLKICDDKGVMDACAILYRRKGELKQAIHEYIQVLTKLSKQKVIAELTLTADHKFNDQNNKHAAVRRFDEILSMIIEICDVDGPRMLNPMDSEDLWLQTIDMIFVIKQRVLDETGGHEGDLQNFEKFLLTRIQVFLMRMAEYVHLEKIIDFLQKINQQNTYQEFQPTFEEKVKRETYNENILRLSQDLLYKDISSETTELDLMRNRGCISNTSRCDKCGQPLVTKWDKQQIQMFKCGHNYHQRCLVNDGACPNPKCYNEYDSIKKIIQSRGGTKKKSGQSRSNSISKKDRQSSRSRGTTATEDSDDDRRRGAMVQDDMLGMNLARFHNAGYDAGARASIRAVASSRDQLALGSSRLERAEIEEDDEEFEKFERKCLDFELTNFY